MNIESVIKKNNNKLYDPYIIAEAGVNHEGSIANAYKLIELAADGGADAIKFQTYKADKIASKLSPSYWNLRSEKTKSQYALFKKYDKFWKKEYELLHKHCNKMNIEFISTPFDVDSAKFLNQIMPVFKISSSDITNKILIEYICKFSKPILLSTGASNLNEIDEAVSWIKNNGNPLALLHCILNYPTMNKNANLGMIVDLKKRYRDLTIGYSDHTPPQQMDVLLYSSLLGAKIIEKHFTFDKKLPGNDHYHSMDIDDLKVLKRKLSNLKLIIGSFNKRSIKGEELSRKNARRSLITKKDIKKGDKFSLFNLTAKRPAFGLPPYKVDEFIGKKAKVNIKKDTLVTFKMINK